MSTSTQLVYGFNKKHRVGSVCTKPCEQCGLKTMQIMTGLGDGDVINPIPLFIVREATYEEYVESVRANGGGYRLSNPNERFYYVVSTD